MWVSESRLVHQVIVDHHCEIVSMKITSLQSVRRFVNTAKQIKLAGQYLLEKIHMHCLNVPFAVQESAGGAFLRKDGTVWCTDKDGIIMGLLAIEILSNMGKDPGQLYAELEAQFGRAAYKWIDVPATPEQKTVLQNLSPDMVTTSELAGDPIISKITHAPANNAPIGGLKISTANAWLAARPSGTENIFKVYVESIKGSEHLEIVQEEAFALIQKVFEMAGCKSPVSRSQRIRAEIAVLRGPTGDQARCDRSSLLPQFLPFLNSLLHLLFTRCLLAHSREAVSSPCETTYIKKEKEQR